jgi:hypothetical protein
LSARGALAMQRIRQCDLKILLGDVNFAHEKEDLISFEARCELPFALVHCNPAALFCFAGMQTC